MEKLTPEQREAIEKTLLEISHALVASGRLASDLAEFKSALVAQFKALADD